MNLPFPRILYLAGTQDFDSVDSFEHHLRILLDAGLPWFQLRDKRLDDRALFFLAERVRSWTKNSGALLTINDRPDLAVLCGADGVHLGQEDLSALDAESSENFRAKWTGHLGISTHNAHEVLRALTHHPDYLGVGPVFDSPTKVTGVVPRGVEAFPETQALTSLPLVAIGGITRENAANVLASGAGTLAVSSLLTARNSPEKILKNLLSL